MMMKRIYILTALLLLFTACKYNNTASTKEESPKYAGELENMLCEDLTELEDMDTSRRYASTNILRYVLKENCLCIKFQYEGCARGNPVLVYEHPDQIKGPGRPEVDMELYVRETGNCEELLTDSVCFSMKRMALIGNEVLIYINEEENNTIVKAQN